MCLSVAQSTAFHFLLLLNPFSFFLFPFSLFHSPCFIFHFSFCIDSPCHHHAADARNIRARRTSLQLSTHGLGVVVNITGHLIAEIPFPPENGERRTDAINIANLRMSRVFSERRKNIYVNTQAVQAVATFSHVARSDAA
jgi:hypothetical protein